MKNAVNKPTRITYGNVVDDLSFPPENTTAVRFKAELYRAILKYARRYSRSELQAVLGEPQPRVSELLNGKIANKSADKLLYYAGRLGIEVTGLFTHRRKGHQGTREARRNFRIIGLGEFCSGIS